MNIQKELIEQLQIEEIREVKFKKTARCAKKMYGYSREKAYFILYGISDMQRFYLNRAFEAYKVLLHQIPNSIKLNPPIKKFEFEDQLYIVYELFEDAAEDINWNADSFLQEYYEKTSETLILNEENLELILEGFLSAWPSKYHERIRKLPAFEIWKREIQKRKEIKVCTEHGDFAKNNIGYRINGDRYLFDLEFVKEKQPIGLDFYEWHRVTDKDFQNVPYQQLNIIKFKLITDINDLIDKCERPKIRFIKEQGQTVYFEIVREIGITVKGKIIKKCLLFNLKNVRLTEWELFELVNFAFRKLRIGSLKIMYSTNNYKNALEWDENELYCGIIQKIETLPKIGAHFSRWIHMKKKREQNSTFYIEK